MKPTKSILAATSTLVLGAAAGFGITATAMDQEPEVETVTHTVTETEAPPSCMTAVRQARGMMMDMSTMIINLSEAAEQAVYGDYLEASSLVKDIPEKLDNLKIDEWNIHAAQCRQASK